MSRATFGFLMGLLWLWHWYIGHVRTNALFVAIVSIPIRKYPGL
jgi:hypothetical protein